MNENSNSPPLEQNEYVQELFSILQENGKDAKGLSALLGHVNEMENFVTRAEQKIADMKSQLSEMKEIQNHPVKTALQNAIKSLEHKVAQVKEQISELKTNIIEGCKSAVTAFKEKGASALNNLAAFFHIKGGLQAINKSVEQTVAQCDKAIGGINKFAAEYHSGTRALKNMGRIIIGKEPIDAKKEAGILAKSAAAPYKAQKAAMNGIKKVANKAISTLDGMEERQAAKKQERAKKPSLLGELAASKLIAAELNRENANRERTLTKGAEI